MSDLERPIGYFDVLRKRREKLPRLSPEEPDGGGESLWKRALTVGSFLFALIPCLVLLGGLFVNFVAHQITTDTKIAAVEKRVGEDEAFRDKRMEKRDAQIEGILKNQSDMQGDIKALNIQAAANHELLNRIWDELHSRR